MSDYRIKVSVRNARLMRAFESIGHTPSSFAKEHGFQPSEVCALAALKIPPVYANGLWRKCVMRLCELTNTMPGDLFTERQMAGLRVSSSEREVDEDAMESISAIDPERLAITNDLARMANEIIDTLSPRSADVFRQWCDGATFDEIGEQHGVTRERVRQIALKAQREVRKAMERKGVKSFEAAGGSHP